MKVILVTEEQLKFAEEKLVRDLSAGLEKREREGFAVDNRKTIRECVEYAASHTFSHVRHSAL